MSTATGALGDACAIRERLEHPVVDADGHVVEVWPALVPYLEAEGVDSLGTLFSAALAQPRGSDASGHHRRVPRTPWWAVPTKNTLDLATSAFPSLLYERLDELGFDFAVLYPTVGLIFPDIRIDKVRRGACRALNRYHADAFAPYADRLAPVAVVPAHTPEEAIEELEFAASLGLKAVLVPSFIRRVDPVGDTAWIDTYGLDSAYDYDPFWTRCVELGVSLATHSSSMGIGTRQSVSNYMYNHIGHFAASGEALAKSLFMGGVTRRFPGLRVALLEGGVGWACALYGDLVGHWKKRNSRDIQNYNPANLDSARLAELVARYGASLPGGGRLDDPSSLGPLGTGKGQPDNTDEWAACGIQRAEQVRDLFVASFAFGCEADDPLVPVAFDQTANPFGARLRAMFGSDIGHWDVPEMTKVLGEAHEGVDEGRMDDDDFRDFVFGNVVRFYGETNPHFFDGTVIEKQASALLAEQPGR